MLMERFSGAGPVEDQIEIVKTKYISNRYHEVRWSFGPAGNAINFSMGRTSASAPRWLRIEFNPRKLGPEGVCDLIDAIHRVSGKRFRVGAFLHDCHVTRIDVAVDIVGLSVFELIVTAKDEGKRVHYYGHDGALESIYVHKVVKPKKSTEPKPSSRKLGIMICRVYDRRREQIATGHTPEFGETPITRVEISKTQFGNIKLKLTDLETLKNPLTRIFVGQATSAPVGAEWGWLEYVELRRGGGPERAAALLALSPAEAQAHDLAYRKHPRDVVQANAVWPHWLDGLQATGMDILIDAANAKSANATF